MPAFQTGQKSLLSRLDPAFKAGTPRLSLSVRVTGPAAEYDLILFGLDEAGRITDDRYTVYYNQPSSPSGELRLSTGPRAERVFEIDLSRLPAAASRLMLAATVDGGSANFGQIDHAELTLSAAGRPLMSYRVTGRDFGSERAIMLLELYQKGGWRVSAVGQGFSGGLAALITHLGGEVSDMPQQGSAASSTAANAQAGTPPTQPPSLQKVTLEKQGASARISLKKGGGTDPIRVNLNWQRGQSQQGRPRFSFGFGGGGGGGADLDLGCMYVMNDGDSGVIQALGNHFGSERLSPHILLDKDDRTGAADDGENLTIFRPDLIHTVLIFAFIYEGTSDFTQVEGRLSLRDPRGNEVTVILNNPDTRRTFCAIATIENIGGDIQITKEERYFHGHQDCDRHYGFGFRWSAGSK